MASAISPCSRKSAFDPFLFSTIGEERNGMSLSVLSALARLELDPWDEAASLSGMPARAATERLTSLLCSLPSSHMEAPTSATVARLVGLLPQVARQEVWSMGAAVKHKSKTSWPVVIYFIFAFATMCAEQIAERREAKGPPDGGASPLVSLIHPDAGKARGE
jgi:hypothetical protein